MEFKNYRLSCLIFLACLLEFNMCLNVLLGKPIFTEMLIEFLMIIGWLSLDYCSSKIWKVKRILLSNKEE